MVGMIYLSRVWRDADLGSARLVPWKRLQTGPLLFNAVQHLCIAHHLLEVPPIACRGSKSYITYCHKGHCTEYKVSITVRLEHYYFRDHSHQPKPLTESSMWCSPYTHAPICGELSSVLPVGYVLYMPQSLTGL